MITKFWLTEGWLFAKRRHFVCESHLLIQLLSLSGTAWVHAMFSMINVCFCVLPILFMTQNS